MQAHRRRKKYIVHKKVQYKYAILTVAMLVLYTMVLLAAIFAPSIVIFISEDVPLSARAEAANAFLLLNRYMWPGIAAIILLFGAVSIFITHRVAGPLFVIERMINQIAGGNLSTRIKLRKGDDLIEFEQSMNRMAEKLEASLSELQERTRNLSAMARDPALDPSSGKQAKVLAEAEGIEKVLAQYTFGKKRKKND